MEKKEFLPLALLFIHSFLNGISLVFFETTANTLFLVKYSTAELPYVYMLSAVMSVIFGIVYTRLENSFSVVKLLKTTLYFLAFVVVSFFIIMKMYKLDLAYMAIMVFKDIMWMFAGIEFGILTSLIFDIRQGKRLFGLLMSGEILAGIIGGLSIGFLMNIMETIDLLIISIISMFLSFIVLLKIIKNFKYKLEEDEFTEKDEETQSNISYKDLLKNKYYLLFFVISTLSFFVFYFIDYIFYFKVEERFTNEKELASFFGIFIATLNIVNLISSLFVSSKVLNKFGLIFGLAAIPIVAIVGTSSYFLFIGFSLGIAFFILIALKLLNEVIDISIVTPTFRIIYQSIPASQRNKVLGFRETIIEPSAMGVAGGLLLVLSMLEGIWVVCVIILVLALIWLVLSKFLKEGYLESLKNLLNKRQVVNDYSLLENIDTSILLKNLQSDNELEVIYALDFLEKIKYEDLEQVLQENLNNKSALVRKKVIDMISLLKYMNLGSKIETQFEIEKDDEVILSLIEGYSKLYEFEAIKKVKPFLSSKIKNIRNHTIISLIKYCGIDGILIAGKAINEILDSNDYKSKIEVLEIINKSQVSGFHELLEESLKSDIVELKKEAIKTIGNLQLKRFVPELFNLLEEVDFKSSVIQAFMKFKGEITEQLKQEFLNTNSYDKKLSLLKLLALSKTKESREFLLEYIQNPIYSYYIIDDLFNTNYTTKDKVLIEKLISTLAKRVTEHMMFLKILDKKAFSNTYDVIEVENRKKIDSIFKLLSFIYPKNIITKARINYNSKSTNLQALAIELLDNIIDSKLKHLLIPIIEKTNDDKKISFYKKRFDLKDMELNSFIDTLLKDNYAEVIIKLSLIYEIAQNKKEEYIELFKTLSKDEKYIYILETQLWALEYLELKKG